MNCRIIILIAALCASLTSAAAAPKAAKPPAAAKVEKKDEPKKEEPKAEAEEEEAPPKTVKVGLYVLNIGKFDLTSGTYTVDFYLDMTSVPPETDMGDPKFEFVNGRAASMDKLIDKPGERFYRIQANLATNVDMHKFPFDKHDLPIVIEPANRGKKELVYLLDEKQSGIDPAVTFIGWNLLGHNATVRDHVYEVYGETYSQYVFTLNISRLLMISSIKTFMPVLCFLIVSMVSLLVALDKLDSRIGLNTAMLLASVLYHINLSSQMPPAGYLTIADKVMMATYGTIALNLLLTVQLMRMLQQKREVEAKKLRELCFKIVPPVPLLAMVLIAVTSV
jgi:hypothetical protein